jgi:hypothetical protein
MESLTPSPLSQQPHGELSLPELTARRMPTSFPAALASGLNGCRHLYFGEKNYELGFNVAN